MKFILPFALFAATLVTAQDPDCEANYIVETCLESENKKLEACTNTDYDCLCRASEAVATCFNNCPKDPRNAVSRSQITIHCANASIHGTAAKATQTVASAASNTNAAAAETTTASSTTSTEEEDSASSTDSAADATSSPNSAVSQLARNTAGVLLVVAGAVAAML
ncbi:hypothetical protein B0T11DRAFT_335614 [Plectosphaerella cucumerina]|uniref:GPI anchored serine-threonine rich protein n=1 Tax=Plectosphaerella cucumerina TaxID=40658 RepID=A0A8K0TQA9_9PEZI|nr:hypothetical protein B0T11DRAFT_335614 [Plectosphaerella cucumerina]